MMDTFRLALLQLPANPADTDGWDVAEAAIREAAGDGAQIMVLPELFRHPYPCQVMDPEQFRYAESVPGPTTERLAALAAELEVVIVGSVFEEAAPGLYFNTAPVLDADGTYLGAYRKMHIPDDPLYYEKFFFAPGDRGYRVFETRYARIGVLICWDQWFPEAARLTAMEGAEVIVYPTAIGEIEAEGAEQHVRQREAWVAVQRGHAVANGVYVAAVNRVGAEGELRLWGTSFAFGPLGEPLCLGSTTESETHIVECSRRTLRETRQIWPFFRDRRIESYDGLKRRFGKGAQ